MLGLSCFGSILAIKTKEAHTRDTEKLFLRRNHLLAMGASEALLVELLATRGHQFAVEYGSVACGTLVRKEVGIVLFAVSLVIFGVEVAVKQGAVAGTALEMLGMVVCTKSPCVGTTNLASTLCTQALLTTTVPF